MLAACSTPQSQVPIRLLLVIRHGIQPRVRQQAATFVSAVYSTNRTIVREAAGTEKHACSTQDTEEFTETDRKWLQFSRTATRSINILALVSYIRVLISRTCNHLSFPIGTPRCHRSLPWALHVPSDDHAAEKLSLC